MSNHSKVRNNPIKETDLKLTKDELGVLLFLISNGTFKGTELEKVYRLALKLQVKYDKLK